VSGVDLWYARTRDLAGSPALETVWALLGPDEQKRHDRFLFEKNKLEFLVTRAVERAVLSQCLAVAPTELELVRTDYGRPLLALPAKLHFNLTNTVELIACAVSREGEVGIDAEPLARADDVIDIASSVFTRGERDMLDRLPLVDRRQRAVRLWTLKEAYMKARGLGMSLPPEQFALRFDASEPTLECPTAVDPDPARWVFVTRELEDHLVSVCVERSLEARPTPLEVRVTALDAAQIDTMLRY
jgi:4'-phosphopantetheinyl transferase